MNYILEFDYATRYKSVMADDGLRDYMVHGDFVSNLSQFLHDQYKINKNTATAIAESLYHRMADKSLCYHGPVHVLSIFSFAIQHGIELEPWQQLALWFHDAVYDPTAESGDNESSSIVFMTALLAQYTEDGWAATQQSEDGDLQKATNGIEATALHLTPEDICPRIFEVPAVDIPKYLLLLDLDICNFAWDEENFMASGQAIAEEFIPIHGEEKYEAGRKDFLKKLKAKGTKNFHSPEFAQFEEIAQRNLTKAIES